MMDTVKNVLAQVRLGGMQGYRNVQVFPVVGLPPSAVDYIILTEALGNQQITVSEVSEGGSVPELKVVNVGEKAILLLDGEELSGAKQNRVLNTSVLVPGNTGVVIPVSCTEHGRWSYTTTEFQESGNVMSCRIRARKASSVSDSLNQSASFASDQGEVWDGIAEMHREADVPSRTGAMRDVYEARKDKIQEACDAFALVEGQFGVLALVDGEVAGLDILSSATAYAGLHAKLVKSYAVQSVLGKSSRKKHAGPELEQKSRDFLAALPLCEEKKFKSVGLGEDCRYKATGIVGSALVNGNCVVHAAFFRIDASAAADVHMAGFDRRRRYRM
jgi:hypothetical protein